MSAQFEDDRPP